MCIHCMVLLRASTVNRHVWKSWTPWLCALLSTDANQTQSSVAFKTLQMARMLFHRPVTHQYTSEIYSTHHIKVDRTALELQDNFMFLQIPHLFFSTVKEKLFGDWVHVWLFSDWYLTLVSVEAKDTVEASHSLFYDEIITPSHF